MTIEWCRLWHDMPTDPKFRSVAKRAGRPVSEVLALFTSMLANASANADERGQLRNWCHEDMGVALDIEPEHVEAIYAAMQGKLLDGDRLTGWDRRQPKREDGSAERAKQWRERKRTQANASSRLDKDSDLDTDSELEKEDTQSVRLNPEPAREATDGQTPAFADLKNQFNGSTEALLQTVETAMGGHCRANAEQWLSSTVAAHGASAVAEAHAMLIAKRQAGEIVAKPLVVWSKTAGTLKAGSVRPTGDSRPQWMIEKDAKNAKLKVLIFGDAANA